MNIALLAPGFLISKKEATWLTLIDLARKYKKEGHDVIICAEKHKDLPRIEEVEGVKVYRIFKGKFLKGFRTLNLLKDNLRFDVVHGFGSSPLMVINTVLAGRLSSKSLHTIKSEGKGFWNKGFFYRFLNLTKTITVSTNVMRNKIIENGCKSEKIKIVRSNINVERFKPRNREELKQKHGYGDKKLVFYFGAIRKEKGIDCLIQAMPSIIDEFPDAFFLFAIRSKSIEAKEKYLQMASELGCEKHIKIILDDVPIEEYVSMADCVVLAYPTLVGTETNPSSMLESMAAKTPVVTTSLPELTEILTHKENVLMGKPSDSLSVADEVKRLFKDEQLRAKIIENAFVKSKEFTTDKIGKEFLDIYNSNT